jgi:hypothetical protein
MFDDFTLKILSAKYLGSPHEYKFWLMAEVKQLAKQVDVAKLRTIFEDLLGPITSGLFNRFWNVDICYKMIHFQLF